MAQIKTKEEIQKVRSACKITDAIFLRIAQGLKSQKWETELELQSFILAEIKKRKLKPSFPPIVTSGPRAGNDIHPKSTDKKLSGFVIIDFGVVYKKYMSDMTRTVYVGVPSKKEREVYSLLLRSQEESARILVPGVKCALADAHARKILGRFAKYFIHTLGHGVGTRIHEAPRIFFKRNRPYTRESMVLTVEPGIYVKNHFGMRIEDTYVISARGPVALTRSVKKLLVFSKRI